MNISLKLGKYNVFGFQHSNSFAVIALSVNIRPSRFAISWLSSSVECDGFNRCTSSAVCGGGFDVFIREGGVDVVLVDKDGGFL